MDCARLMRGIASIANAVAPVSAIAATPSRSVSGARNPISTCSDVVITTAMVPGRPAPKLVTAEAADAMKPGSVIVDLAGEAGGNCELARPGETYTTDNQVIIAAPLNLPSSMPEHASQLYARNILSLVELMAGEDGALHLDWDDEVIAKACVARDGEVVSR